MTARPRPSTVLLPALAALLSGCIFGFPPFGPPLDLQERTVVVENATDQNWVITVTGEFAVSYAIPAGATGPLSVVAPSEATLELRDPDCNVLAELAWDETIEAVRIGERRMLTSLDAVPPTTSSGFTEFFACSIPGLARPTAGEPLPDESGAIILSGSDLRSYRLDVAEAALEPLGTGPSPLNLEGEHALSPGGRWLAFSRSDMTTPTSALYLARTDGSDEELLVEDAGSPKWSPEGSRIAYQKLDPFASMGTISVIDLEKRTSIDIADGGSAFSWSPDGTQIAFMWSDGFARNDDVRSELRIVNADGSELRTIAPASVFASVPAWSPDGSRIAFMALVDESGSSFDPGAVIAVHDLATDRTTRVAAIEGGALAEPAWSPSGDLIAVTIGPNGFFDTTGALGIVPASGGEVRRIGVLEGAFYATPVWSPSGRWVAATRTAGMEFSSVLVAIDVEGAREVVLAESIASVSAWRAAP